MPSLNEQQWLEYLRWRYRDRRVELPLRTAVRDPRRLEDILNESVELDAREAEYSCDDRYQHSDRGDSDDDGSHP